LFPVRTVYRLTIVGIDDHNRDFGRDVVFDSNRSRGCAISVESLGNYSIFVQSEIPAFSGLLGHDGISSFSASQSDDNLYFSVQLLLPTPVATARFTQWDTPIAPRIGQFFLSFGCFLMMLPQ
jgi:hypothetical protein